ncbi:hypothetical protein CHS0354_032243 [Potamilus streckersoni]|uniref:Uncharacterized protein n=1 Tax=Potamilus streckersoni TaxID=2493646 RepID=A0AAE0VH28_9BIVA|nr:hypothetical protein CHS0354_032243 [Potamilus streckersoni]
MPGSAGKLDIYNITGIPRAIEMRYNEDKIAVILSFSLNLGGNDFIPKFYGISHEMWLKGIFENETFRRNLFKIHSRPNYGHLSVTIDTGVYINLLKNLYCLSKQDADILSLEEGHNFQTFMEDGGLKKVGYMVEYELGPHVHYDNTEDLLRIPEDLKEALTRTRMRRQRKRELIETPGKD